MNRETINKNCNELIGEVWCCGGCNAPTGFEEHSYCKNCEKSYGNFSDDVDWCHPYAAVFMVQKCSRLFNKGNWKETVELYPLQTGEWRASTGTVMAVCDSFYEAQAEALSRAFEAGFKIRKPQTRTTY